MTILLNKQQAAARGYVQCPDWMDTINVCEPTEHLGPLALYQLDRISLVFAGLLDYQEVFGWDGEQWPLNFGDPGEWYKLPLWNKQDMLFYEWEYQAITKAQEWPKLSLDECYVHMEAVFANYKHQACPDLRTIRSDRRYANRINRSTAVGYWNASEGVIALRPDGQDAHTILHEAAHVVAPCGNASHGEGFRKKYRTLLKRHAKFVPEDLPEDQQWIELAYQETEKQYREEQRRRWAAYFNKDEDEGAKVES